MSAIPKSLAVCALIIAPCFSAQASTMVYTQDFSLNSGYGWSSSLWTSTSGESFLGAWDDFSTTLSLNSLQAHNKASVSFDLYVFGSVYGNTDPAIWSVTANDGSNNLFSFATTFSNVQGYNQSFPNAYLQGDHPAQTQAKAINPFYYGMPNGVTAYHLDLAFEHTTDNLNLTFKGTDFLPYVGPTYGRWGLDNVSIAVSTVPEPSSSLLMLAGIAVLAVAARKKQKQSPFPN